MKQPLTKSEMRKGRIFWAIVIVLITVISCLIGECMQNNVRKNGVYTIMTLDKISYKIKGGKGAKMHYTFRGQRYDDGTGVADAVQLHEIGRRFFMMVMPDDAENWTSPSGDASIPSWFTLEAPCEGWETMPTKMEMYRMMVQDSISKGLKTDTIKLMNHD